MAKWKLVARRNTENAKIARGECEVRNLLEGNEGFFGLGGDALRIDGFYNHCAYDLCIRAT